MSTRVSAQTEVETTASNVRMTINNIGIIGNAFKGSYNTLGYGSCEYPKGSGIEHLFDGGLWVGAIVNGQKRVTTGAIDASGGYSPGICNFEWTVPAGNPQENVSSISSLLRNPGYDPAAISHQDFRTDFTDKNLTIPGSNIRVGQSCPSTESPVVPLGLDVHMEAYNWNYTYANYFVILNFTIRNTGSDTLKQVATGMWADGVVRNIRKTPPGGTPFFNKGGNGYLDSLHMGYEFDAAGDVGFTDSYIGIKFLGLNLNQAGGSRFYNPGCSPAVGPDTAVKVFYNTWVFNSIDPNFFTPNSEIERYNRLITGLNYRPNWESVLRDQIRQPSNRSNLVSIGALDRLAPGESINVVYAVVLAMKTPDGQPTSADSPAQKRELAQHAQRAQSTYNGEDLNCNGVLDDGEDVNQDGKLTRFILPAPPETPIARAIAGDNKATLYWAANSESSLDPITRRRDFAGYRIYKSRLGFDLQTSIDLTGSLDLYKSFTTRADSLPFLTAIPEKGNYSLPDDTTHYTYKLEVPGLQNGWQHVLALTAFDSGNVATNLPSLETSPLENLFRVFPGTLANGDIKSDKPFVYPNPYYGGAAWERSGSRPEERKLYFANLPNRAEVRILTQAGDFVDEFTHNGNGYRGGDAAWYKLNSNTRTNILSGGEHAWDLLSKDTQIIARGVYLYAVKDLDSGKEFVGKFTIIK